MKNSLYTVLGLTALSFSKSMGSVGRTNKLFIKEYPLALFKRSFVVDNSSGFLNDDSDYMMISNHIKKRLNEFYLSKYNFNNFVKVQIQSIEADEPEWDIDLFIYSFTGISPVALELAESIFTEYFTRMGVTFKDTSMFGGTYEKWQLDREKQKEELVFKGDPTDNLNDLIDQWYDFPIKKHSKLRRR